MNKTFYYLLILTVLDGVFNGSQSLAERYKPLRERTDNRFDRYESKPTYEKRQFDQNLNRYNSYSPTEKRQATEKWRSFKENTTPQERQFIMEKMRDRRQNGSQNGRQDIRQNSRPESRQYNPSSGRSRNQRQ